MVNASPFETTKSRVVSNSTKLKGQHHVGHGGGKCARYTCEVKPCCAAAAAWLAAAARAATSGTLSMSAPSLRIRHACGRRTMHNRLGASWVADFCA